MERKYFEDFCNAYNLDYDFTHLAGGYKNHETEKAFIIYKYAGKEKGV